MRMFDFILITTHAQPRTLLACLPANILPALLDGDLCRHIPLTIHIEDRPLTHVTCKCRFI